MFELSPAELRQRQQDADSAFLHQGVTSTVYSDYADVPPTRGVFRGEARSELAVLVTVSLPDSPIRPDRVLPMTTWSASDTPESADVCDYAQQQQQQQQQQQ